MKRTKSMTYKPTEESRELKLYADNTYRVYQMYLEIEKNLDRKISKGIFDNNKAIDLFYHLATFASDCYFKQFGYRFSVTDRYTVAVEMVDDYMNR